MYIAFLDESGIGSKQSNFFMLGALCIDDEVLKDIGKGVRDIKNKFSIPPDVEIKWSITQTNEQLAKKGLQPIIYLTHKEIKKQLLNLIMQFDQNKIFILWIISPLIFYTNQKWRSYDYALNILLKKLKENIDGYKTTGIVLIDELSGLAVGMNATQIRGLMENYIHTFQKDEDNSSLTLFVPNVNSTISYGHQVNDILIGAISYYLYKIHQPKDDVTTEIIDYINQLSKNIPANFRNDKKVAVLNAGIMIYPQKQIRQDLKRVMKKTYDCLYRDFKFG